jgi:hypothetical protein
MKSQDDTPSLDFRILEIHEKAEGQAGGSHIIKTLRRVFVGEPFGISGRKALVSNGNEASAVARMPRRLSSLSKARW